MHPLYFLCAPIGMFLSLIQYTVQYSILRILVSLTFCQALSLSAAVEVVIPFARAAASFAVVMAAVNPLVFSAVVVSAVVCSVVVHAVVVLLSVRAVVVSAAAVVADGVVI
jgi:hypothetical protein